MVYDLPDEATYLIELHAAEQARREKNFMLTLVKLARIPTPHSNVLGRIVANRELGILQLVLDEPTIMEDQNEVD